MNPYRNQLDSYIDAHQREFVEALSRLIAQASPAGEAKPGMPFGEGPDGAMKEALKVAEEWGFPTRNYDGYVGLVDLNSQPDQLHILAHMDVVAAGSGWDTDPYQMVERDGVLYGRGVADDKGPALAALLAMRAVKESGIPLAKNVKLLLGTDEESGSSDIAYYYGREPYAPNTISPDAEFPVINIEKGHYHPEFTRSWAVETALPRVAELTGGIRLNVVPPEASALVLGLDSGRVRELTNAQNGTGVTFDVTDVEGGVRIDAHGVNAHASTPDEGRNAITALLDRLAKLPLAGCESTAAIKALHTLFPHGDNGGKALGIAQSDPESGALTLAFSLFTLDANGCKGQFDARVNLTGTEENCKSPAERAFAAQGFQASGEMSPPHVVPANDPFVQTLLDCYTGHTGREGKCLAIGGGTYVHSIPGGVAYGACELDFDCRMHGANERVPLEMLITCAKIYADAIVRICGA
ncbi:MAG: M20 family metallopeptidase [Oscillospiraceae bacterium]|nr:M20 family metallopeptidase [Oscillospiraceae bacterium]